MRLVLWKKYIFLQVSRYYTLTVFEYLSIQFMTLKGFSKEQLHNETRITENRNRHDKGRLDCFEKPVWTVVSRPQDS